MRVGLSSSENPVDPAELPAENRNPEHTAGGSLDTMVGDVSPTLSAVSPPAFHRKPAASAPHPAPAASSCLFSRLDGVSHRRLSGSKSTSAGGGWVSKVSDNEHTLAPLGHAEELRVEYPPCQTVPERIQGLEQASEILPIRARERSRDVLPKKPTRHELTNRSNILPHETGLSFEPGPRPGDAERLAGASTHNGIWPSGTLRKAPPINLRYVPEVRHAGEPMAQDRLGELVHLAEADWVPPERAPRHRSGLYAAEHADVPHDSLPMRAIVSITRPRSGRARPLPRPRSP